MIFVDLTLFSNVFSAYIFASYKSRWSLVPVSQSSLCILCDRYIHEYIYPYVLPWYISLVSAVSLHKAVFNKETREVYKTCMRFYFKKF